LFYDRGESSSLASSLRKNEHRTIAAIDPLKRKYIGRRGDVLIRKRLTEYGCGEIGKIYEGTNGTKIIKERGLKLPKMLKDIFNNLASVVDFEEKKIRKLETVGFICSGMLCYAIYLLT